MDNTTSNCFSFQLPLFDFHSVRPSSFSQDEHDFYLYLASLDSLLLPEERNYLFSEPATGRKGFSSFQYLAVVLLKMFRRCSTVREVLSLLQNEPNYAFIIGFDFKCVSESSMSRRVKELEEHINVAEIHERLVSSFYKDRLVCNLSIDSTPIDVCEKPVKKEKTKKEKGKKGRKKKGSDEEAEYQQRQKMEAMLKELRENGNIDEYMRNLENRCSCAGKMNSKGNMAWRIGLKAHFSVDDNGIPICYFVTGMSVHDSKAAIPILRKSNERCNFLYALMDSGYYSKEIAAYTRSLEKVPVIDPKADRNGIKPEMDPAKKQRYKARTTVERTNSELKSCFLPDRLHSRGWKARLDISIAILLLTMKRMRNVMLKEQAFQQQKAA